MDILAAEQQESGFNHTTSTDSIWKSLLNNMQMDIFLSSPLKNKVKFDTFAQGNILWVRSYKTAVVKNQGF